VAGGRGPLDAPCAPFNQVYLTPLFSAPVCEAFRQRLGPPIPVRAGCWVFPVRR
jgi:hypothetical protein